MLETTLHRSAASAVLSPDGLDQLTRQVVLTISEQRSSWTRWNVYAETERVLRSFRFSHAQEREAATETVMARATGAALSIRISEPELVAEPEALCRDSDGQSVFVAHGTERYTTSRLLQAEEQLVEAATSRADVVDPLWTRPPSRSTSPPPVSVSRRGSGSSSSTSPPSVRCWRSGSGPSAPGSRPPCGLSLKCAVPTGGGSSHWRPAPAPLKSLPAS